MSITHKFEERELRLDYGKSLTIHHYGVLDVRELLAHTRALEVMLKKHEWHRDGPNYSHCPECHSGERYTGHSPDCQLARLLEGVE